MKYIIIIGDGMGDLPVPALDNHTPLEAAQTPYLDRIAKNGRTGLMQTVFPNLPVGSIVANMGILGFDPYEYFPHGRASFEALAKNITLHDNDLAFRCNLISLDGERIRDFTAGLIPDQHAQQMLTSFRIEHDSYEVEIYPGMSYRNLLIVRNANINAEEIVCFEPHMNIGQEIHDILPHGRSVPARQLVPFLRRIVLSSIPQFKELNAKYHTRADMIWLWSPSAPPAMPSLNELYGISGGIVCGMDFLKGIGCAARLKFEHIPGTNAYIDTNYAGKLDCARRFLHDVDLVYVHINAPDEEAHQRNVAGKVKSIELLDSKIIGPLYEYCEAQWPDDYRMMILPDHYTLLSDGTHTTHLVPVTIYGKGIIPDTSQRHTEREAARDKRDRYGRSYRFMRHFLHDTAIGA